MYIKIFPISVNFFFSKKLCQFMCNSTVKIKIIGENKEHKFMSCRLKKFNLDIKANNIHRVIY